MAKIEEVWTQEDEAVRSAVHCLAALFRGMAQDQLALFHTISPPTVMMAADSIELLAKILDEVQDACPPF